MTPSAATFSPVQWLLALSVAGTFIGHGSRAVTGSGDPQWARYLATAGIGRTITPTLLPLIGAMDIALGVAVVLYPHPLLLAWAVVWALAAAAMRPLSGESAWTAVEMSGNWLPALALLWDTTASEGTTYQWMLTTVVLLMLLVAATLLLRQTGLLADRPRTGR